MDIAFESKINSRKASLESRAKQHAAAAIGKPYKIRTKDGITHGGVIEAVRPEVIGHSTPKGYMLNAYFHITMVCGVDKTQKNFCCRHLPE